MGRSKVSTPSQDPILFNLFSTSDVEHVIAFAHDLDTIGQLNHNNLLSRDLKSTWQNIVYTDVLKRSIKKTKKDESQ